LKVDGRFYRNIAILRTGKEIRFRFGSSEDKADTASRSRSQPKMENNLFTSPNYLWITQVLKVSHKNGSSG
jgi:hypothetical protein